MGYNGLFFTSADQYYDHDLREFSRFPPVEHRPHRFLADAQRAGMSAWGQAATRLITQPWSAVAWKSRHPAEQAVGFFGNRHALALILKRLNDGYRTAAAEDFTEPRHLVNCTDASQTRRPAPFGVRPALFSSGVRSRRVAPSPPTVWRRASRRALRCGQPACAGR